ncbi:hypothetical protein [Polaromonas sp.]|uniref:hypothetical protein n=1 Tax=Polaromonas sp. TaxID=1869339 RepID=UPI0013BD5243|nr:hypothetical protein [Polaromonas sp.]NDP63583.1 hypothetical protein [Polaromonas sp.]
MRAEKNECLFFLSKKLFITLISFSARYKGKIPDDGLFATDIAFVKAALGVFGVDRMRLGRLGRLGRLEGRTGSLWVYAEWLHARCHAKLQLFGWVPLGSGLVS